MHLEKILAHQKNKRKTSQEAVEEA